VPWAVATVEDARSSPASEAVAAGAVDGIADTIDEVLRQASGRTLVIDGAERTLDLAGSSVGELGMNPFQSFLHLLSDPNIAFLLFTIGFYGLFFELQNPNFVTGILGGLSIILAFIGFGSLPLNVAGLLLIGLAVVLFILESTVVSHGLLTLGGLACFLLGASALYTAPGDFAGPIVAVAFPLLAVMALTAASLGGFIAIAAFRTRRTAAAAGIVGTPVAIGEVGVVRLALDPTGSVYLAGEEWTARTTDGAALERGTPVRVVSVDGLTLVVEPNASSSMGT
jgi:membrane-bound serine protease (ClpP class)